MSLDRQKLPHETLEATVARLVTEALRACGGDLATCNLEANSESKSQQISEPKLLSDNSLSQTRFLSEPVISAKLLEDLKVKSSVLQIGTKAVVTPAARDWLRQNSIRIERQTIEQPTRSHGETRTPTNAVGDVLLADVGKDQRANALARQLSFRGLTVATSDLDSLLRNCQVDNNRMGLVISKLPAIEQDLVSRVHSMRAAAADSVELVRRISGQFSPQVWVLDAERLTLSGLVAVAETCIRMRGTTAKEVRR